MEVTDALLPELLNGTLILKMGDADSEVVMCSESKTFALKKVETTNLQLLIRDTSLPNDHMDTSDISDENHVPELMSPAGLQTQLIKLVSSSSKTPPLTILATNQEHIEVVEVTPKLGIIERLLSSSPPYKGEEEEEDHGEGSSLYSLSDLEKKVQASKGEILEGLMALNAVQIGEYWRLIHPSYLTDVLSLVVFTCREKGWDPLISIPVDSLTSILAKNSYRPELIMHALKVYGTLLNPSSDDPMVTDEGQKWALDEVMVSLLYARIILEKDPNQMPLISDFMEAWTRSVSDHGFEPKAEWLTAQGECLLIGKGATMQVKHFPVCRLQKDPLKRFGQLFSERLKWTQEELQPYIQDLKVPGCSSGAILLKYARVSQATPNDPVFYSAR